MSSVALRLVAYFLTPVVLLVLSSAPITAQSAIETVTIDAYLARVDAGEAALSAATAASAPQVVRQVAEDLAAIDRVELPDGTVAQVKPLLSGTESRAVALARLGLVRGQLQAAEIDRAVERLAALDGVLASDALHPERGLLGWLRRLLDRPLASSESSGALSTGIRGLDTALGVVGGIAAVIVLGLILQALLGNFVADAELRRQSEDGEPVTAALARQQAAELASAGNYREAVRRLYLSTLLSLEDRGLLRIDRSLTNHEVLASVPAGSDLASGLRPIIDTYEAVWYGQRNPGRAAFDQYVAAVDAAAEVIKGAPLPVVAVSQADRDGDDST